MKRSFLALIFCLLLPVSVFAAATISGINDSTLSNGQTGVVITGSSFGTKSDVTPETYEDWHDGADGELASYTGYWKVDSDNITSEKPQYSNDNLRHEYEDLNCQFQFWRTKTPLQDIVYKDDYSFTGDYLYYDVWIYHDFTSDGSQQHQIKMFKFCSETGVSGSEFPTLNHYEWEYDSGNHSCYTLYSNGDGIQSQKYFNCTYNAAGGVDSWHHWQLYFKNSAAGSSDASIRILRDGTQIVSDSGFAMRRSSDNPIINGHFGKFIGNSETVNLIWYYSTMYVDDYWQHIELGDASTYATCTHREIQKPTAWSSTSATFTVNRGGLTGDTAYVYLIDSSGDASNGYEISFSDTEPPDPGQTGGVMCHGIDGPTINAVAYAYLNGQGGAQTEEITLGKTDIGADHEETPRARGFRITVPEGGMTVEGGGFYGYTYDEGTDGTFELAVWTDSDSGTQVGSCSNAGAIVDGGSPDWNVTTFETPFQLDAGTYRLLVHFSEGTVTYNDYSTEDDSWRDPDGYGCGTLFTLDSDQLISLYVDGTTVNAAPTISGTPSIVSPGSNITVTFSETVDLTGYTAGDFDLDCNSSGTNIALSSPSGSGSSRTFTLASSISAGDTCNLDFNGAADSIEDASGIDMTAVTDRSVTVYTETASYTEEHWVTQSGAGSQNGESLANAWSAADFNTAGNWDTDASDDGKIGPDDIVYFSGEITTTMTPPGSGSAANGYITLDGYEAGECDPIDSECTSACTLTSNATTGSAQADTRRGFSFEGVDYFVVQDFRVKNHSMGMVLVEDGSDDICEYFVIRRNYYYQCYRKALGLNFTTGGECSAHVTIGGAPGQGNLFVNNGYNREPWEDAYNDPWAIQISGSHVVFSYNKATNGGYSDDGAFYWGANIIECQHLNDDTATWGYMLYEYNVLYDTGQESCLALKEAGGRKAIIRFNDISGAKGYLNVYNGISETGHAITIGGSTAYENYWHDVYVYGNNIHNAHFGVRPSNQAENIYIYANTIHDIYYAGVLTLATAGGSGYAPANVNVINNTFYDCGKTRTVDTPPGESEPKVYSVDSDNNMTGIRATHILSNLDTRNNIFYNCRNSATSNHHIMMLADSMLSYLDLDYTTYYRTSTSDMYYYGASGVQNLAWVQSNSTNEDHGENANPSLTNPALGTPAGFQPTSSTTNGVSMAGDIETISITGGDGTVYSITPNMRYIMSAASTFGTGDPADKDPDDISVTMVDNNTYLDRGAVSAQ